MSSVISSARRSATIALRFPAPAGLRAPLLALSLLVTSSALLAQQRPLRSDTPETLPVGRVRFQIGIEFLQDQRYSLSGLEGDLTRVGVMSVQVGVGEYAEFQVSGVAHDFLAVSKRGPAAVPFTFSGNTTSDFGDVALATKLRLAPEKAKRPALSFKFAVELPNATNESGLGVDETRFYAGFLLSKRFGRAELLGNVGFGILPCPLQAGSQTDTLTYGFAVLVPVHPKARLVGEISGRQGAQRVDNENHAQIRVGVQLLTGRLRWDIASIAGLKEFDPDSGVTVGVAWEFQGFHKQKRTTTVK